MCIHIYIYIYTCIYIYIYIYIERERYIHIRTHMHSLNYPLIDEDTMSMIKPVCRAHLYHNIVQLEVCRTCSGRGMGINGSAH